MQMRYVLQMQLRKKTLKNFLDHKTNQADFASHQSKNEEFAFDRPCSHSATPPASSSLHGFGTSPPFLSLLHTLRKKDQN